MSAFVALLVVVAGGLVAAPAASADSGGDVVDSALRPTVTRIAGADRYELAARLALETAPAGARTVYVASGANYPDALSAGPAAVHRGAPLLLVQPTAFPAVARSALVALAPTSVIVVGGPLSVSDAVLAEISAAVPRAGVARVSGADRYEGSRAVIRDAFPGGASVAFVATGRSFPDALSAGAAAGTSDLPVLLVDGALPGVDIPTESFLGSLRTTTAVLVGGTSSVSAEAEFALKLTRDVQRIDGVDRYRVSQALNARVLQDFSRVYLVTGENFPDALAGGVLAGTRHNPLFVVPGTCVPRGVLSQLDANGTSQVVLLGGTASLSADVAALTPCAW
ncbi:cell wall-binding repeat-containing protein [Herbiconiux sp. A18JL235]|uniref:Cell wall-binding repeat-containing protein n=1 Tax=Herbiconiux sp. A18JL235 TaxID=3152363 RepID=A0AB39BLY6_9MICO